MNKFDFRSHMSFQGPSDSLYIPQHWMLNSDRSLLQFLFLSTQAWDLTNTKRSFMVETKGRKQWEEAKPLLVLHCLLAGEGRRLKQSSCLMLSYISWKIKHVLCNFLSFYYHISSSVNAPWISPVYETSSLNKAALHNPNLHCSWLIEGES